MLKKYIIGGLLLISLTVGPAWAYDLTLTKIGTMSTIGADYSLVSYVGAIPALEGTATPAAQVSISINSNTVATMAATVSGVWRYLPPTLNTGDNTILIASGEQNLNFVLRYNLTSSPTPTATPSAVTKLPDAGNWQFVVAGIGFGITVWYLGLEMRKKMRKWERGI